MNDLKKKLKSKIKSFLELKSPGVLNLIRFVKYSNWMHRYKSEVVHQAYYKKIYGALAANVLQSSEPVGNKPLVIITTFNDHDIIEAIVRRNAAQGLDQILIDNWSTDGTWSILEKLQSEGVGFLELIRYPFDGPSPHYEWKKMLDLKSSMALKYPNRWIFHQDSDEVTISPWINYDISRVLHSIKDMGYNAISLRMIDFQPVDDKFEIGDPVENFKYFHFSSIPSYSLQNKIWYQEVGQEVDLSCMGGHDAQFPGRRLFPIRLPRYHYSVRSSAHSQSKYAASRMERTSKERNTLGWHTHIENKIKTDVVKNKEELILFEHQELYSTYFDQFTL
ncbi:glycosyltransferase family 2 protein [Pseudomonas protegens]|uniref:glycosyltransferase family 2 protein n=1 Tax=Pseudomonas protegens TaxID=380021 RepID=UPI002778B38C|nr:glycosyltransferase family 2 protein [Pseudomonas protegens]MDP9530031.1 glycosyltransferase family 2 protein [Pseudomonas protegens]